MEGEFIALFLRNEPFFYPKIKDKNIEIILMHIQIIKNISLVRYFYLIFFFWISLTSVYGQIHINELIASNSSNLKDPDFGDTGDWIELYNSSEEIYDLSGHFLSDNLADSTKWAFPNATKINPKSFLLIWADGKDIGLHSNFKLTKAGEEIGLFSPEGELLDFLIYEAQSTDVSYGRTVDGGSGSGYFLSPTPAASNTTQVFEGITFSNIIFSEKGGFYDEPLTVELTSLEGNIRYTLDGSLPTETDLLYTEAIPIDRTTVIRASVFLPNFIPSKAYTNSYFFQEDFESRGLPVVSLATNPEYFWDAEIGLYVQDFKPTWEYPVNIELFENDGGNRAAFNELGGTKVNGLNSWELPQKMLGIYFDNEYDKNNVEYPLFFDRNRTKYDNFILRASGSDWSETLFRDGLCQGLTSETMDLEKAGFRPAIVFINGEYLGIHNLRSRINESFIEDNFGYASNEYDLIENNGIVEEGNADAFNHLFDLLNKDLSIDANFQAVTEVMDIDNFADFLITEVWTSNSSWGHNLQLWKPKAAGTKWRWILQDFDRGFSGAGNNGMDYFTTDSSPSGYEWARTGIRNILNNNNFGDKFAQRFADHLYTTFHPVRVNQQIQQRKKAIEKEIPYHVNRWAGTMSDYGDGITSVEFWQTEVNRLTTFAQEREGFIINDLQQFFSLVEAVNLGTMAFPNNAGQVKINEIIIPDLPWNGRYFKNMPFELTALPYAGHRFTGWSVATSETLIPKQSEWKYLDDGSNQQTAWQQLDFNDASWAVGQAELGYGDGDENTIVSFGNNANNKFPTTYFRKTVELENVTQYTGQLTINLLRDDAAAVYLNGKELLRSNLPEGNIAFDTYAVDFVADAAETSFVSFFIPNGQLVEGKNVLAVEVHQSDSSSSDISFDLELKAWKSSQGTLISTEEILAVNLSTDTAFIATFIPTGECVLPSVISENTILSLDCSPYLVPQDVTVLADVSLVIPAGVILHFSATKSLTVLGDLQVEGTADQIVQFLPNSAEGVTNWGQLNFQNTNTTSHLTWVEIIGASRGKHPVRENAAISAWKANLDIDHLKITEIAGNPIFTQYSNITLKNSQLHSEITGDLINVKYGFGQVENCDFRGNQQIDTDAIDFDEVENGIIRNNKIYDFFGFNSDGIDLGEQSANVLIENNFIHNITDKGLSIGESSAIANNNTIVNCNQGIGVKDLGKIEIDHCTFYNNGTAVAAFEKNIGRGGGDITISNSILSNSAVEPISIGQKSGIKINQSLSDTEPLAGQNMLYGNPLFQEPSNNNFQLQAESPAIKAGTTGTDLGTSVFNYTAPRKVHISAIQYNPADDPEAEFIEISNPSENTIDLSGYTFTNGISYTFPNNSQIPPNETIKLVKDISLFSTDNQRIFQWTSGKLSNAGEQIILKDAYGIVIDHVLYDDKAPWLEEADGKGAWLTLISPELDNHFAESWQAAVLVGLEEAAIAPMNLTIFPNPASQFLSIESETTPISEVAIFNLLGQQLHHFSFDKERMVRVDLEDVPSGVVLVRVNGAQGVRVLVFGEKK